jgi:hypothetical protein
MENMQRTSERRIGSVRRGGLAVLLALMVAGSAFANGPVVTQTYSFENLAISKVNLAGQEYDRLTMPGAARGGAIGAPALPSAGAYLLLPQGAEVTAVNVVPGERVTVGDGFFVEPNATPYPLSADPASVPLPEPDASVYAMDTPYPAQVVEQIGVQTLRGYKILVLRLYPVEYVPSTGTLSYYRDLTVNVETKSTGVVSPLYRGLAKDAAAVAQRADNATMVSSYPLQPVYKDRSYDLLIITTPALASTFEPLKAYHDAHGIATEIHTTADIGSTNPSTVRNYIRTRYQTDGIDWVIIGGDDDVIPAQDLYVRTSIWGESVNDMPGDVFFQCLDGTWNYDGDGRVGEPTDGEGGGDVDLMAEVWIGRASVGNATEAARYVNKTLGYLNGQHDYLGDALLVGEYLGFGGDSEYAANTLEELVNGSSAHGYTTVGIPSGAFSIDTLFERDRAWSKYDLRDEVNGGLHILNHLGHGSPDYAMHYYNDDIMNLWSNDDHIFVYSQTCLAGHFDGTDCWAETANIKSDYAAFAVIMNARYGYGAYNSTDGPSQRFNREFWDAVFNSVENKPQLGRANMDSKEDNLYRINDACMRWCYYELNLFGDPTVEFAGESGMEVSPAGDYLPEGEVGGPFRPSNMMYTVRNLGITGIEYSVTKTQPWVTVSGASGYLPGGGMTMVIVSINAEANSLPVGTHYDTLTITNETDHEGDTTREVVLEVLAPAPQACCYADATCAELIEDDCLSAGGVPQGEDTICADVECPYIDLREVVIGMESSVDPTDLCPGESFTVDVYLSSENGDINDLRLMQFDTSETAGATVDGFTWDMEALADMSLYLLDDEPEIVRAVYATDVGLPGFIINLNSTPQKVATVDLTFGSGSGEVNLLGPGGPPGDFSIRFQADFTELNEYTATNGKVQGGVLLLSEGPCDEIMIVDSYPPDGAIDARRPHDPSDPGAREGWAMLTLEFDGDVSGLTPADFATSENGGDGTAPDVASVTPTGPTTVEVTLDDIIEPLAWTTLTHVASGTSVMVGYLPGDANQDAYSSSFDSLALIDHLNGIVPLPEPYATDIDRSGVSDSFDILELINLLNGAGAYDVYNEAELP